ncbi:MAG TPA: rhodanese-like domain-containing protein, partial [Candidatus Binatia bacterium]
QKTLSESFDGLLRTNGERFGMIKKFRFMLSPSKHAVPLFRNLLAVWVLAFSPAMTQAGHETRDVSTIAVDRLKLLLDAGEKFQLIDIRPAKEFQEKRIPGSRSIPTTELDKRLGEVPKSGRVVVYAATPQNDIDDSVFQIFEDNRYRNITFMLEGFQGWLKRKYPVETGRP